MSRVTAVEVIQGRPNWYQSKSHMRLPISLKNSITAMCLSSIVSETDRKSRISFNTPHEFNAPFQEDPVEISPQCTHVRN